MVKTFVIKADKMLEGEMMTDKLTFRKKAKKL